MDTKILIIDPALTINKPEWTEPFIAEFSKLVAKYGIFTIQTECDNVNAIDSDSVVVVINDESYPIDQKAERLLKKAKDKGAKIYPVAMDRDKRNPPKSISEKQSYDVWEQLRRRDLSCDNIRFVARCFARTVISEILPTMYSERGMIFYSHRRLDGEEITADLCDAVSKQFKESRNFRDVVSVKVGENAQDVIDKAMPECDAFVFIHTERAADSDWIQKELRFAILRNMPILWVQIDGPDINKLKVKPSEGPNLSYNSNDFADPKKLAGIADEIMEATFDLIRSMSIKAFDFQASLEEMFGQRLKVYDKNKMIYSVSAARKGYSYPQRDICQYIQLFGRTPIDSDKNSFREYLEDKNGCYDSGAILTDRVLKSEKNGSLVTESYEDFLFHWGNYLSGGASGKNKEIIISGAFPDCDEVFKQSLADAIVIFVKAILKSGYNLTFGSHPTFQDLFIEISEQVCPEDHEKRLKMYASEWFSDKYIHSREYYSERAEFIETEKRSTINESLTEMRREMIQRREVAAVVCLGGKIRENKSEEGIREEIALARSFDPPIPVFVVGSVGGCSAKVASEYKDAGWNGLNNAPPELNLEFAESVYYFALASKMLKYLNELKNNFAP